MARPAPHRIDDLNAPAGLRQEADAAPAKAPGAAFSMVSRIAALAWIAGASAAAIALIGFERLQTLSIAEGGAIGGAIILPALMAWFAGAAASEAARARREASRLADAADRLLNPEQSSELAAKRLSVTVRNEIGALDRALEQTLARLADVQTAVAAQAKAVDDMGAQAKSGAGHMITGMERERAELLKISEDLTRQAKTIGDSISRHTAAISEAARQAETEVHAADQALDLRITSFGAAAAMITDRTAQLSQAAQSSSNSAEHLETALAGALDALTKATDLTDAARRSAEEATSAAHSTAGAIQDVTARAIEEAKVASQTIRGEAASIAQEAEAALERLRMAAEAARAAAMEARAAAEAQAESHYNLYPPSTAPRRQLDAPPGYAGGYAALQGPAHHELEDDPYNLQTPAPPPAPVPTRRRGDSSRAAPPPEQGNWTWRDLLSNNEEAPAPRGARGRTQPQPSEPPPRSRRPQQAPEGPDPLGVVAVIEAAGLHINEVFSASGLDRIAQRARAGTQARRRAVVDAAPDAVEIVTAHLQRDARANQEAMRFLRVEGGRISELLGRGRAAMGSEATRAFLLIDAAAG